jgi:hypothetical protein
MWSPDADCDIGSIFTDFIPWWNSPDTHMDLVTVDLRLSYEMSYDSRLFWGGYGWIGVLEGSWVEVGFNGAGGFLLAFHGVCWSFLVLIL